MALLGQYIANTVHLIFRGYFISRVLYFAGTLFRGYFISRVLYFMGTLYCETRQKVGLRNYCGFFPRDDYVKLIPRLHVPCTLLHVCVEIFAVFNFTNGQ